jgi:hypothetical protein
MQKRHKSGFFQQRYVKRHAIYHKLDIHNENTSFRCSQNQRAFRPLNFGDVIPTESRSLSSEESYSPSRLVFCQDTTQPFAMVWNRISRAFAAPGSRGCPALLRCGRMP